jgi:uncharacterized membrane protein
MNYYLIAKFIHILGALGFFIALGLEWMTLWHARQAISTEQARERLHISNGARRLGMPSMLLTLVSGIYMTAAVWGPVPWILVALGALVLLVVLGLALTRPRMMALGQSLMTENGPVSARLHNLLHNSLLWLSLRVRVSIALDLVFLMTVKPNLVGSLLTMGAAIGLGLVLSLPIPDHTLLHKEPAD